MSQSQCGRSASQLGYPSRALVSRYLTNKLIGRGFLLQRNRRNGSFDSPAMRQEVSFGISPNFFRLSPSGG